jgi:hypothetical protein
VVTHDPDLALRDLQTGGSVCVLKKAAAAGVEPGLDPQSLPLRDLIKEVVLKAGRPLELNDVVSAIAEIQGIRESGPTPATTISIDALGDRVADPRPAGSPDDAAFLRIVWAEVGELPLRQRTALLLNLRDEAGRSVLALFPLNYDRLDCSDCQSA